MPRRAILGVLLLIGVGVLLGGTLLRDQVASARALAQSVLVSNTPAQAVPVIEQRNPAFEPFQRELAPKTPFCGEAEVPAGRRLVIEFVSGGFEETQRRTVIVITTAGGETVRHFIKLPEFNPAIEVVEGGQEVRLYADPSTVVRACLFGGLGVISLSGYLVRLP